MNSNYSEKTITISSSTQETQLTQQINSLQITTNNKSNRKSSCLSNWFTSPKQTPINIIYQHILNCQLIKNHQNSSIHIQLTFLNTTNFEKQSLQLKTLDIIGNSQSNHQTTSTDNLADKIQTWIHDLMKYSYPLYKGIPRNRTILIIINPASGSKKSLKIWSDIAEPILKSSNCKYEVIFTTHAGHAAEIGETMDLNKYHVVSCISGDGLIHEFLNGLGLRKLDFSLAMKKLALTSIPAGSGNALSANHIGPKQSTNIHLATLNLLKGRPTRIDLCSITQLAPGNKEGDQEVEENNTIQPFNRRLSFLSVSFGLMADLDVGTEHLRWMGPTRFMLGFIWGAIRNKPHKIRLDLQLIHHDKHEIAKHFYDLRDNLKKNSLISSNQTSNNINNDDNENQIGEEEDRSELFEPSSGLPKLQYGDIRNKIKSTITSTQEMNKKLKMRKDEEEWITIETDVSSLYAGVLPFMSDQLLQFPAKIPGYDSSIHLTLHRPTSVWDCISCLIGAESGQLYKKKSVDFYQVKAFRLTPISGEMDKQKSKLEPKEINERDNLIPKQKKNNINNVVHKNNNQKEECHIALDGESLPFSPLQVEIHPNLLLTLSLIDYPVSPYFGSIGIPDHII